MIPFTFTEDGFLHTFLLYPDEDDDQRLIQKYAEARPNSIYFFANLCEPEESKKTYFVWRENPHIGGEITEAFSPWAREDDPDRLEESIAEQAKVNSEYIYFYVESMPV